MHIANCLLPAAYCLLPVDYRLLHAAYYLLPIACCVLHVAYCLRIGLLPTAAVYVACHAFCIDNSNCKHIHKAYLRVL